MLEAVLKFELRVRGETIAQRGVDPPKIMAPRGAPALAVGDGAPDHGQEVVDDAPRSTKSCLRPPQPGQASPHDAPGAFSVGLVALAGQLWRLAPGDPAAR